MSIPLNELGASALAKKLAAREIKAEHVVRACLDRIDAREEDVKAWVHVAADAALKNAQQLDKGPVQGLLHGLPIGVKDLFDTVDMPTMYVVSKARLCWAKLSRQNSLHSHRVKRAILIDSPTHRVAHQVALQRRLRTIWCLWRLLHKPRLPSFAQQRFAASLATNRVSV
jgi:hypothetical protein